MNLFWLLSSGSYFTIQIGSECINHYTIDNRESMCNLFCIGLFLTGIEVCLYSVYVVIVIITQGNIPIIIGSIIAIICLVVEYVGLNEKRLSFMNFSIFFRVLKFGSSIGLILFIFKATIPRFRSYGMNLMLVLWYSVVELQKLCHHLVHYFYDFSGLLFGPHWW